MDSNVDSGTVGLLSLDSLNVDGEFLSVALDNFSGLLTFVVASGDHNFVVFTDRDASNAVFLSQVTAERGAHDLPSDVRRSREVAKTILSS